VLHDLDLRLEPGRMVALAGASGAGKSTLLALLLRFVEPSRGRVLVGSTDLATLEPDEWRSRMTWLPQRPHLGSGTIAEAIAPADPDVPREDIVAAAVLAGADAFITRLPAGYDTHIGEGGVRLSGGQRQRIGLARAFLRQASVVLLDEPTAHLDDAAEARVIAALGRLVPGRIVIAVTHRRMVMEAADEVVVMERGRALPVGVGVADGVRAWHT
jgi:ABC-type multidrug transport system fused ATPase/permease subunit